MPLKNQPTNFSNLTKPEITPFPVDRIISSPGHDFLKHNGYMKLSSTLNIRVYSDMESAEKLWKEFSPDISLFDLWDIRKSFYDGYKFSPYFLTVLTFKGSRENMLGILPLWFTSDTDRDIPDSPPGKYVWFGSNWPEDNLFFVKDTEVIPLLLTAAPSPLDLACIKPLPEYNFLNTFPGMKREEDKKYFLDISNINTVDDYLARLKKKKRYNLKRDRKHILSFKPQTFINRYEDIEQMFRLSIERFREKYPDDPNEYSAFEDDRRKEVFRSLISNAGDYEARTITTVINGNIEAVEFGLVYKGGYYAFNAGTHISSYPGLGIYSNLLVIEDALKLKCKKIDFLEGDNNWKESWHLDFLYQYRYKK